MGKSLIIIGANFSTHAIAAERAEVPCTALTLSITEAALTVGDTPITITATKTPLNTTEGLRWKSSDTSIAVCSGGTITAAGAGTAVITATCGTQTATCTVTVTAAVTQTWTPLKGYFLYATAAPQGGNGLDTLNGGTTVHSITMVCATGNLRFYSKVNGVSYYPYKMPSGTTKVRITMPNTIYVRAYEFSNSETAVSGYPECVELLYNYRGDQFSQVTTAEIDVPVIENYPECDSFAFQLRTRNDSEIDVSIVDQVTIEFI